MNERDFAPTNPELNENEEFPTHFQSLYYPGAGEDFTSAVELFDADHYHLSDINQYFNNPKKAIEQLEQIGCENIELSENPKERQYNLSFTYIRSGQDTKNQTLSYNYGIDATTAIPKDIDLLYCHNYFPISGSKKPLEAAQFLTQIPAGGHIIEDLISYPEVIGLKQVGESRSELKKEKSLPEEQLINYFILERLLRELGGSMIHLNQTEVQSDLNKKQEIEHSILDTKKEFQDIFSKLSPQEHKHIIDSLSSYPEMIQILELNSP